MSGASGTSEWRSKWPSTLRVDFIVLLPTVECAEERLKEEERWGKSRDLREKETKRKSIIEV